MLAGISIGLLAVAASIMLVNRSRPDASAPLAPAASVAVIAPAAQPTEPKDKGALDINALPSATAAATAEPTAVAHAAAAEVDRGGAKTEPAPGAKAAAGDKAVAAAPPAQTGLSGAMASAVGATGGADSPAKADDKKGPAVDPGSIPEAPSQGAIQGALGAVMGAARACVAGMDEPSRASITFGSDGRVQSVSVSGPAAATPAGGCIRSALQKARVGPFQRSSFSVGATVRP
jgi:hypothetical protein